jgi:hypothetical protein
MTIIPENSINASLEELLSSHTKCVYLEFGERGKLYTNGIIYPTLDFPLKKGKYKLIFFVKYYEAEKLKYKILNFKPNSINSAFLLKNQSGTRLLQDINSKKKLIILKTFSVK